MAKHILYLVCILLSVVELLIALEFKKYIKLHENELVENHMKGLLSRYVAMTVIPLWVGIIAIIAIVFQII